MSLRTVVFWVCVFGFLACRIAFAWRIVPGYQRYDTPLVWIPASLCFIGAMLTRPATVRGRGRHMGFIQELPTPIRVVLGLLVVLGIFYFARMVFNGYYGPLAQATNGVD